MLDRYNEWKDNCGKIIPDDDTKRLRQSTLENLEESLEFGKINEGKYLELVNKLKNLNREDLNEVNFAFALPQVVNAYNTFFWSPRCDPQIINCYC